jgi:hypothetical protein
MKAKKLIDVVLDNKNLKFVEEGKDDSGKTYYRLDNPYDEVERTLSKYDNIEIGHTYCEYAPEIKKLWVSLT